MDNMSQHPYDRLFIEFSFILSYFILLFYPITNLRLIVTKWCGWVTSYKFPVSKEDSPETLFHGIKICKVGEKEKGKNENNK